MKFFLPFLLFATCLHAESFERWLMSRPGSTLLQFAITSPPSLVYNREQPHQSRLQYTRRALASGVRVREKYSSDLQTWQDYMPISARGFLRLEVDHSPVFGQWSDAVDDLTGTLPIFASNGQRSVQCWGGQVDLTPLTLTSKGGVLVSPRHVLLSTHYHAGVGETLRWVDASHGIIERRINAVISLPATGNLYPDITVGVLDAELPAAISPVRVLNPAAQLPEWAGFRVPCVIMDQERKLLTADVQAATTSNPSLQLAIPVVPARAERFEFMVSGDSGSPVCLIHEGRLVLLSLITFGGPGQGPFIPAHVADINAAMLALGGGHTLTLHDSP